MLYIEYPDASGEVPLHSTHRMQVEAVDVSSAESHGGEVIFIEKDIFMNCHKTVNFCGP